MKHFTRHPSKVTAATDILSFKCPGCKNKTLYSAEQDVHKVADVDENELFICDECGGEFRAHPQYNGSIRFTESIESATSVDDKKIDRRLSSTSKRYKGYRISLDNRHECYNIYDAHGELEDHGFKSVEDAMAHIDELVSIESATDVDEIPEFNDWLYDKYGVGDADMSDDDWEYYHDKYLKETGQEKYMSGNVYSSKQPGVRRKSTHHPVTAAKKRIARIGEWDNGHVIRNDWRSMSPEDAEEEARKQSLKDPEGTYYVAYDDVMNPCSPYSWKNGKRLESSTCISNGTCRETAAKKRITGSYAMEDEMRRFLEWNESQADNNVANKRAVEVDYPVMVKYFQANPDAYVDLFHGFLFPKDARYADIFSKMKSLGYRPRSTGYQSRGVFDPAMTIDVPDKDIPEDLEEALDKYPELDIRRVTYHKGTAGNIKMKFILKDTAFAAARDNVRYRGTTASEKRTDDNIREASKDVKAATYPQGTYWMAKYKDMNGNLHKIVFQFDSQDFDEAEEEMDAVIPEPYTAGRLLGRCDPELAENDGFVVLSSQDIHCAEEIEDYEDDIQEISQEFTSENTSINSSKLPAIFKMISLEPGTINIDYGGGRFDNVADYLTQFDVINLVYDPYNRTKEHNSEVIRTVRKAGGADTATCSNVLNVIKEPEVRQNVLQNIKKLVKPNGTVYITVYEGSGKGNEGPTKSGYQLNRKTEGYLDEIKQVFPDAVRKGKLIVAHPNGSAVTSAEDLSYDALTCEDYIFDLWTLVEDDRGNWVRDDKIDTYDDYATARAEASALAKDTPCQLVEVGPDGLYVAWTSRLPDRGLPSRYWEPEDYSEDEDVESVTAINAGHLIDPPQQVVDSLIQILNDHGFVLDPRFEINPGKTWMGNIHLQVIDPDSNLPQDDFEALKDFIDRNMFTEIRALGNDNDCPITWSFGVDDDGHVTGGLDINKKYVDDQDDDIEECSVVEGADYGGAYDIEPNQFFTKEEIVEFGNAVADRVSEELEDTNSTFVLSDVYMDTPTLLHIEVTDNNMNYSADVVIDMRRIRKPQDLHKYETDAVTQIEDDYCTQNNIPLDAATHIDATASGRKHSIKTLHDALLNRASQIMRMNGFPLKEIADYLVVDIQPAEDGWLNCEVRAELSYEGMSEMIDALNPIVQKYDKDAYFDHVTGGIISAYLPSGKFNAIQSATDTESSKVFELVQYTPDSGENGPAGDDFDVVDWGEFESEEAAKAHWSAEIQDGTRFVREGNPSDYIEEATVLGAWGVDDYPEPPESDEPEERNSREEIIIDLDDDIVVEDDGNSVEFLRDPAFLEDEDEWTPEDEPMFQIDDGDSVYEHVMDLIIDSIPAVDGKYHIKGRLKLLYDVTLSYYYEGTSEEDQTTELNRDGCTSDYDNYRSEVIELDVTEI